LSIGGTLRALCTSIQTEELVDGKIGIDLVESGEVVFHGANFFGSFVLGFEDIGDGDREGAALGVLPFGEGMDVVANLPAGEVTEASEDFIKEVVFGFGEEVAGGVGLLEGDFVVVGFGDVVRPGGFGSGGVGLFVDEIEDLAEDRAVGHGDVAVCGDGAAPAAEGFAVGEVKEFDELHVAHAAAARTEEAGGCLGGLWLIEGHGG